MKKSVVVIGAGQGGLSAAIHARLLGHDVLVLEQGPVGGKAASISQSGYRLDPGPSIIILRRLYEDVFRRAGRRMDGYLRFNRLDPISRVFMGEGSAPIDLPAGRDACTQLVRDLNPSDGDAFAKLMDTVERIAPAIDQSVFSHPYHQPWQMVDANLIKVALPFDMRKTYRQLVDGWFQSPLLRAFFYGFPSYGGQSYDSKAPGALMIPYLMIQEGVFYPVGGVAAIPAAFERLARELGVEFRTGAKVIGFERQGSQVVAALLESGEKVKAQAFISNVDKLTTRSWLGFEVDFAPSFSYFTVHWGIRRRMQNTEHHTLLIPQDYERGFDQLYRERAFPNPPIVYLNDTSKLDPSTAPEGCTNLFAVVTSPSMEVHLDWASLKVEATRLVRQSIAKFGFEFEDSEIDFERVQSPPYFAAQHGNYRGSLYGPDEPHRLFGTFPLRCRDEDIKNLFYAGGSVQPGAGLPMVTLSGKFAADLI